MPTKPWTPARPLDIVKKTGQANWRGDLRARVGTNGEKLWEIILGIAEGQPLVAVLPDGREAISVPNADTRLKAAIHLAESLFGKAVSQVEQVQAEGQADELKAMGDLELERRARDILARGLQKLDQKLRASNGTDIESDTDQIGSDGTSPASARSVPTSDIKGLGVGEGSDQIDSTGRGGKR